MNKKRWIIHLGIIFSLLYVGLPSALVAGNGFLGGYGEVSSYPGKAMAVDVADLDRDGVQVKNEVLPSNGIRKLFYLTHKPIHRLLSISVDGVILPPRDPITYQPNYTFNTKRGWTSFSLAYKSTNTVIVHYEWSNDLDVAVAQGDTAFRKNTYYINNSNFSFTEQFDKLAGVLDLSWTHDVSAGDIDGDGDIDLLLGNSFGFMDGTPRNWVMRNDGGLFTKIKLDAPEFSMTTTESVHYLDYDNDGDLDIFLGRGRYNASGATYRTEFFKNDNGVFNQAWGKNLGGPTWGVRSADYGDFDLDGDSDILIAGGFDVHIGDGINRIYENRLSTGPFLYAADSNNSAGCNRIIKVDNTGLEMMASYRDPVLPLNTPKGIAVDDQFTFVADSGNNRVLKFQKATMNLLAQVSGAIDGISLLTPTGVEVDNTYLYICDNGNNRVLVMDKISLAWVATLIGSSAIFAGLSDVAVDATKIYVTDSGKLFQFDKFSFAEIGTARSSYNGPPLACGGGAISFGTLTSVDVDSTDLYLLSDDARLHKVEKTFSSCVASPVGSVGVGNDQFQNPSGVSIDDTYVYVSDKGNKRIHKRLKSNLSFVKMSIAAEFMTAPWGIDIDTTLTSSPEPYLYGPIYTLAAQPNNFVMAEDMDSDGRLDIVSVGALTGGITISIRKNITSTSFSPAWSSNIEAAGGLGSIDVADLDGDGLRDLVTHRMTTPVSTGKIYSLKNIGGLTFSSVWTSDGLPGAFNDLRATRVALADMNGDGAMDAVFSILNNGIAGTNYYNMAVLKADAQLTKVIKLTSESQKKGKKVKIIQYYTVGTDGKLKNLIGTTIK